MTNSLDVSQFSRREFLRLSSAALISLLALGSPSLAYAASALADDESTKLGRLTKNKIDLLDRPSPDAKIIRTLKRDDVLQITNSTIGSGEQRANTVWYELNGEGYVHSGSIQPVVNRLNDLVKIIPTAGLLAEVTVPYTQSLFQSKPGEWTESYRLYYDTTHWVVGIAEGPDGEPWYRIRDEMLDYSENKDYYIPAKHARLISPSEMTPLATDVAPEKKRIEVSLENQELTAYEDQKVVLKTKISSGLNYTPPGESTWNTPTGYFNIESKMLSKHMGNETPYNNYENGAYVLPGVSWVSFFEMSNGVAFHGTHWHQDFGMPKSHGCINMKTDEARWIYRWSAFTADPQALETTGFGTSVHIY